MKQISWSPRAFVFKGLLSDEECGYLINNVSKRHQASADIFPACASVLSGHTDSQVRFCLYACSRLYLLCACVG